MKCKHVTVLVFGAVQLCMGIIILACGITLIVRGSLVANTGHGIWGGLWVIITGVLGIVGGIMKMKPLEIAFMVLSILSSASIWLAMLIISLTGMVLDAFFTPQSIITAMTPADQVTCAANALNAMSGLTTMPSVSGVTVPYGFCYNGPAVSADLCIIIMSGLLFTIGILSAIFSCCAACRCCGATSDDAVEPMGGGGQFKNY